MNTTRAGFAMFVGAGLLAAAALPVDATASVILAETAQPSTSATREKANTTVAGLTAARAVEFSVTQSAGNLTADLFGISRSGDNVTAYITTELGPGAAAADIVWSTSFTPVDLLTFAWHSVNLGSLTLDPGDYFFVLTSAGANGFEWSQAPRAGAVNVGDRGVAQFQSGQDFLVQTYTFASAPTENTFGFRLTGESDPAVPAPAPGALLIAPVMSLLAVRRRRTLQI